MVTKRAVKATVDKNSSSTIKRGGKETGEARVVVDGPVAKPEDAGGPRVETKAAADAEAKEDGGPVPNVQAEANHASQAPEDIRKAEVAAPSGSAKAPSGAHVESYAGGSAFECSEGDFVSRVSAGQVEDHIAAAHAKGK